MSETLELQGLRFEVRRSARRRTVGLTVGRKSELVVYAPKDVEQEDLIRWTRSKLLWVHRKLTVKRDLEARVRSPEYVSGESFSYLGRRYRLKVVPSQDEPLSFGLEGFRLKAAARATAPEFFRRWYSETGSAWIQERVHAIAHRVGAKPAEVEIRDLGFRWGSCTNAGKVFINWKLLQLSARLADYVIAHELAHLVEHHHGPAFRALMSRAMPDWKARKEQLRRQAQEIYWCYPGMDSA